MGDEAEALYGVEDMFDPSTNIVCKRCGHVGLHWEGPPWRLFDCYGQMHVCKTKNKRKNNEHMVIPRK
jgi:hypothetical protein